MNVAVGAGWRGASGAQDLCRWGQPLPRPLSVSPLPPRSSSCLGHPQGFCSRCLRPSGPGCPAPGAGCSPATGHRHGVGQGLALPSGLGLPTQTKNLPAKEAEPSPTGGRPVPACWRLILVVVAPKMSTGGHGSPARCSRCRLRARAGDAGRESWALAAWPGHLLASQSGLRHRVCGGKAEQRGEQRGSSIAPGAVPGAGAPPPCSTASPGPWQAQLAGAAPGS